MKPTLTFDIFLLKDGTDGFDPTGLLQAVRESPIRSSRDEPTRCIYQNPDTRVYFQVLLSPEVLACWGTEARVEEEVPAGENPGAAFEEDDADEEEETVGTEVAPITVSVPYGTPSFFGKEAAALADKIAVAGRLRIEHCAFGVEGEDAVEAELTAGMTLVEVWNRANRSVSRGAILRRAQIDLWNPESAEAWWAYGSHCKSLDAEFSPSGIHVPRLEAARHEGKLKSLFVWDEGTPAVFPCSDLVLVRRERERKGLLFRRKVMEEGLVSRERLWDILAPFSEIRETPARLLVFRDAVKPPQQIAARLETLVLEPLESARRTEFIDIVDFEIPAGEESPA